MMDACGRTIDYLRISITDKCNLRCVYCMPEGHVEQFTPGEVLTYEEIVRVVTLMAAHLGVKHLRVTGGEPTVRRDWMTLVRRLKAIEGIETIAMTTNGVLLQGRVREAREAGLDAINVSIDSLNPVTYRVMTRVGSSEGLLPMLDEAIQCGIRVKLNAVPVRGMNDEDLTDLAMLAKDRPMDVRFIELMPVGCGAGLSPIPSDDILRRMESAFGPLQRDESRHGFGPAKYVKPAGFIGSIGVISAVSHEFCDQCNRVRLTADGYLKLCLNHTLGLDIRALLRGGVTDEELVNKLRETIAKKPQRHGFNEKIADKEDRRMHAIGG